MIRSLRFDGVICVGCALAGILAGLTALAMPAGFAVILLADVWILGSQHVIATYTRLCFDAATFRAHRFLVLGVPWLVLAGVVGIVAWTGGPKMVTTIYMYWQWHHYVTQSYSIERIYAAKEPGGRHRWAALVMFAVPFWGICYRSWQKTLNPKQVFLTFDFWAIPIPDWFLIVTSLVAVVALIAWGLEEARGTFHTLYVVSHSLVFFIGYFAIGDITYGWLVINVWHNLQYVLMVWMYNNNRFHSGIDPNARFLSYISQRRFVAPYFFVCIALAGAFYKILAVLDGWILQYVLPNLPETILQLNPAFFSQSGLVKLNLLPTSGDASLASAAAIAMLTYQVVNFHHYIADALIWRVDDEGNKVGFGL